MRRKEIQDTTQQRTNNQQSTDRVVILGSGYAGIHACKTLLRESDDTDNLEIILLSDVDHLLYVTMIYEVPAGNLAPSSIRQSVRTMVDGTEVTFRQGTATTVDTDNQTVMYRPKDSRPETSEKAEELTLSYDYLVSAIGSETEYFDTPGAKEYTYELKRLDHAKRLKNTLINNFERATLETDTEKIKELLTFVVVGGGPTGVTLAAKISDVLNHELARAFPDLIQHAQVYILEANNQMVERAGPWFANNVTYALQKIPRLTAKTACRVQEVRPDGVVYDDEEVIRSECVIWTAGVKARELDFVDEENINIDKESRRIHVTPRLHVPGDKSVFVAGDQAWVERIDSEQPYPMRAQFAVRQGRQVARNILALTRGKPQENFRWEDKGLVVSVGHGRTFADVFGIKMSGFFATIAYKSIYLLSTIGVRAKLRASLEWFMNLFLPRDISEL